MSEVAVFVEPNNQFEGGESAFECVAFGCATIYYSGPPNGSPSGTTEDIDVLADKWYTYETGSLQSTDGLSVPQELDILTNLGMHWQQMNPNVASVINWLQTVKTPVLICGAENGFYDIAMGRVPYNWPPSGNHCIVASGVAPDGVNLLVRDYANINPSIDVPGSVRTYDASKMNLVSATAVYPRWWQSGVKVGVPTGWKDDGTTLMSPTGIPVVLGFRQYILSNPWDASNIPQAPEESRNPLEESNPSLGSGSRQVFRFTLLEWTSSAGVFVASLGSEYEFVYKDRNNLKTLLDTAMSQIKTLQAGLPIADMNAAMTTVQTLIADMQKLIH